MERLLNVSIGMQIMVYSVKGQNRMTVKRPLVGIGVLVRDGSRLLLMKRQNSHGSGTWSSPGGHLEYGESFETCAIRETFEETGVIIANPRFLTITNDVFEAEGKHYITVWMESSEITGEPKVNSEREMSAVEWFPLDALPEPLFLPLKHFLNGQYTPSMYSDKDQSK